MRNFTKRICAVLAVGIITSALFMQKAQAVPIRGLLQFTGLVVFDSPSINQATQVTAWTPIVSRGLVDFSGISAGTPVTVVVPWTLNPSTPTPGLWQVGGFTFDLLSSTIVHQSSAAIIIDTTGIISGNGFTPTPVVWRFAASIQPGRVFRGDGILDNGVPDAGSTVALLGIGLGVIAFARLIHETARNQSAMS